MNVLVIGCGLLGRKIARTMDEMGWDVSVLSNIESDLELLENDFEGVTFRGFPMDIRNLREAGIESCDAVAVTTADDNLNITVAQIARDYFGIQNVVARASDPARELIFEHMGLHTICPTNHAGDRIVRMLSGEKMNKKIEFGLHTVDMAQALELARKGAGWVGMWANCAATRAKWCSASSAKAVRSF